jgi:hypothetical protein
MSSLSLYMPLQYEFKVMLCNFEIFIRFTQLPVTLFLMKPFQFVSKNPNIFNEISRRRHNFSSFHKFSSYISFFYLISVQFKKEELLGNSSKLNKICFIVKCWYQSDMTYTSCITENWVIPN